jgi:hypothetical protein
MHSLKDEITTDIKNKMNQSMNKMRIEMTEQINKNIQDQIASGLGRIEKYLS